MSQVTASLVKELRDRTGLGMMECKRALAEAGADIDKAIEELRKSSGMKAAKKAGRTAADGIVLGMKFRLWVADSDTRTGNATITSSNGNIYKNTIVVNGKNEFLRYVDLTGCYLVEEKEGSNTGTETTVAYMNETFPNSIHHIISHEIDASTINNHIIELILKITIQLKATQ